VNSPRYHILANPDSKRWQLYAPELTGFWREQGIEPEINLVPWRDVVPRLGNLDGMPQFDKPGLVRLESPGRDWEVMKLLLEAGVREESGVRSQKSEVRGQRSENWCDLQYSKGRLFGPGLLYRGFCCVLEGLRTSFDSRPHLQPLACPLAIAELFDKQATADRLRAAGLPTPVWIPAPHTATQLLDQLRLHGFKTAYVKLNTGSSAVGMAAVHPLDHPPWAITTMRRRGEEFFNTRRLQRVSGPDLEAVLQFILGEGAFIQEGITMAQIDGQNFDIRVVVLHGEPAFAVFRLSSQPMTNLHLGGRRGRLETCRPQIPTRAWLDAIDHCVEAACLYPCAALGVDLLFERGYGRHFLLEINAFGDFFPGLADDQGRTVHRREIEMTAMKFGWSLKFLDKNHQ
jgi:hypothetical protein